MTRVLPHPARDAVLAVIQANPGLRRAEIADRLHKGLNATSRLLYSLHKTGRIVPSGIGKLTTWAAVPGAPKVGMPTIYTAAPIQSYKVPFGGCNSIFSVGEMA